MSAMISMMISSGSIMPAASRAGMTSVSSGTPITPSPATSPDLDRPTRNTASAATRRKVVSGMDQEFQDREGAPIAPSIGGDVKPYAPSGPARPTPTFVALGLDPGDDERERIERVAAALRLRFGRSHLKSLHRSDLPSGTVLTPARLRPRPRP